MKGKKLVLKRLTYVNADLRIDQPIEDGNYELQNWVKAGIFPLE